MADDIMNPDKNFEDEESSENPLVAKRGVELLKRFDSQLFACNCIV